MKKIVCAIIILVIITITVVIVINVKNAKVVEEEKRTDSQTVNIEGREAKYTFLKNKDGSVYGIKFENLDLIEKVSILTQGTEKEIKDLIIDDVYTFTEENFYRVKILMIDGKMINTDDFIVNIKK